jgi:hypothetical protein
MCMAATLTGRTNCWDVSAPGVCPFVPARSQTREGRPGAEALYRLPSVTVVANLSGSGVASSPPPVRFETLCFPLPYLITYH